MPSVSIIIATYNRASMVKEAIQSVLEQTYQDFEIIVVDDGSTDDTREVLAHFGDKIRYVYQPNQGRSNARNHGISLAQGDYIAFLDSDDKFLPNKLSTQVRALDSNPDFGMSYSYFIGIDKKGNLVKTVPSRTHLSGIIYPELLFIKGTIITTPTAIVRRQVLAEIGGFDERMSTCEDLDLWRRIARYYKVLQIEEPLAVIRYRRGEKYPLKENVEARSFYYQKAISEDPSLSKTITNKLFSEMYCHYGLTALLMRKLAFAVHLIIEGLKLNPFLFPFRFIVYAVLVLKEYF